MRLRTLGRLELEGTRFTKPIPLLLLTYLTMVGPTPRHEIARALFEGAVDSADSLSIALRRLKSADGKAAPLWREDPRLESCVDCDALELLHAHAAGDLADVIEHYTGPFLQDIERHRSVEPERWSYAFERWLNDARLRVARAVLNASVRLARVRFDSGAEADAQRFTDLALAVFDDDHHAFRERKPGRVRFDPADLRILHALVCHYRGDAIEAFQERADGYPGLDLADTCEAAVTRELRTRRSNLEPPSKPFVGRSAERADVAAALAAKPRAFVTLLGRGGVGKTSLATRVALDQYEADRYPDGVYFVSLEDLRFANLVPVHVARTLDVPLHTRSDALDQLTDHLAHRQMLLVLDNYDHLLERRDVPARIVEACPGVAVVVTSRERLAVAEERVVLVEGLSVADNATYGAVGENEAMTLFVLGAQQRRDEFELTDDTARSVSRICRLAAGHPLSIDLAVGLVDLMPLQDLADRMERDLALLATESPATPKRHRSLRSVWESSWALLDDADRALLEGLAIFDGGFDWNAASEVAGADLLALRRLVDKSLLRASDTHRFSFHASLRAFVLEKAADDERHGALRDRHRAYYLERARAHATQMRGREAPSAIAFFEREAANLRAAWLATRDLDDLVAFVDALEAFQNRQGNLDERQQLLQHALDAADEAQRTSETATILNALASIHIARGALDQAHRALKLALAGRPDDAPDPVLAESLSQLGGVHYQRRELDHALDCFERARRIHELLDDTEQAIGELGNIGAVHYQRGDHDGAIRIWKNALVAHRRSGDLETQALLLSNLGAAYQVVGSLEEALLHHEKAKALFDTLGDTTGATSADIGIGSVHFLRGAFDASLDANRRALEVYRQRVDAAGEALVLNNLAMIHERRGDLGTAFDLLREALSLQEHDDERVHRAVTLYNLSTVTLQLGRTERAIAHAREAIELADETGHASASAYARTFLGDALAAAGDHAAADDAHAEAAQRFEDHGDPVGRAELAVRRAERAYADGDTDRAHAHVAEVTATARALSLRPLAWRALRLTTQLRRDAGDGDGALASTTEAQALAADLGLDRALRATDARLARDLGVTAPDDAVEPEGTARRPHPRATGGR